MTEADDWPDRRRALATLAVLFLTASLCTIDRLVLNLVVDPIRHDLAISETQISLLQGLAFSLFYSLAGLPLGALADRTSRRRLLIGGVAVWSLATALSSVAPNYPVMFLARTLVGAGEATLFPVAVSLIADLFPPRHRGKAISSIILGQIFGSSLALIAGGTLLKAAGAGAFAGLPLVGGLAPWRITLLLCAGLGVAVLMLLAMTREPQREAAPTATTGLGWQPFKAFVAASDRKVALVLAASFLLCNAVYASTAWTTVFYLRHFRMGPGELGPILGTIGLASGIAGTMLAGFASDRAAKRGDVRAKAGIIALAIVGCLPAAFIAAAPSFGVALGLTALASVCYPLAGSAVIILLQDLIPPAMRGFGMAVNTLVGGLFGASLGPFLTALATDHLFHDDAMVGWSLALVMAPSLVATLVILAALRGALRRG